MIVHSRRPSTVGTALSASRSTQGIARGSVRSLSLISAAALVVASLTMTTAASAQTAPKGDDEKAFYSIGAGFAQQFQSFKPISDREIEVLIQGLRDGLGERTLAVDEKEGATLVRGMVEKRQAASSQVEKTASAAFAATEGKKPGAETTESGLIYTVLKAGTGESPTATDKVRVHYHGTLRDGTVFDSSVDRGEPAEFPLNRVIPCWTEGVALMKKGGKSRLVCPAAIAYGDRSTGRIPGGATLVFEVELLDILR